MKKLLIFIFISFVAQKAAANREFLGQDAAEIIEKGKVLEVILDKKLGIRRDYSVYLIYKGNVHHCFVKMGMDLDGDAGFVSRSKCIQYTDRYGIITKW
jgi:hypothetical protein